MTSTTLPPEIETVTTLPRPRQNDDMAMLRAVSEMTRDLVRAKPTIYWPDLLASVAIGYGGMALALSAATPWLAIIAAVFAIFGLYRAGSFIHELTHIKRSSVPGFWLAWNALVGIPLLMPSFMYEGVHSLHHARTRYGTIEDPEYLPLALMKPWTVPLFVVASALAPLALLVRYGLLAPLSLILPPLRRLVVARYSGLVINPSFRRRWPEGLARREWYLLEAGASIWAILMMTAVATQIVSLRSFIIIVAIVSASMVLNQIRTLVAHLWENDGETLSVTEQFLDSVNVPPPSLLPYLWAPVGLRYHALHHLVPALPYHALGEAHRRLTRTLDAQSTYHRANYSGLPGLVGRLVSSTISRTTDR